MIPLVISLAFLCVKGSTVSDPHYIGAVVEYRTDANSTVNLHNYLQFIAEAARQEADIVVFPEMTLTRSGDVVAVPFHGLLKEYPTPALRPDLYNNVLVQLSQAALDNKIYVLVNVQEELDCASPQPDEEACPSSDIYRFNTNVVFDRNGSVIDRYRKINLFGEFSRTPAFEDQLGVFSTDFGVTFGHFICFDLMFQVPAVQVVQKYNITDVIFSTMWFSEMPFLTAVSIQEAYAYENKVNFLASGASRVDVGSAGSGIYSGRAGALISLMPGVDTRQLLVAKIPKIPGDVEGMTYPGAIPNDPKVMDGLLIKRDLSLPAHVTRVIERTEELQQFQLTDGEVTCDFTIRLRDLDHAGQQDYFRYRAYAQDDTVTYANRVMGVSACAVIACVGDDVTSCAERSPNTTLRYEFTKLQITQRTRHPRYNETLKCNDSIYYPVTLKNNKYPVETDMFTYKTEPVRNANIYHEEKDHAVLNTIELVQSQKYIMTFGIWGRIFDRDVNKRDQAKEDMRKKFQEFEDNL